MEGPCLYACNAFIEESTMVVQILHADIAVITMPHLPCPVLPACGTEILKILEIFLI